MQKSLIIVMLLVSGCLFRTAADPETPDAGDDTAVPSDTDDVDDASDDTGPSEDTDRTEDTSPPVDMKPVSTCTGEPDGARCDLDDDLCTLDRCENGECVPGPDQPCEECQRCVGGDCVPDSSVEGEACGAFGECYSSSCIDGRCTRSIDDAFCLINGTCYPANASADGEPCKRCTPSLAQDSFSPAEAGTSCDDDPNDCDNYTCAPNGTCNAEFHGDGTLCDTSAGIGRCEAGVCEELEDECVIGGVPITAGTVNPQNPCQICNPTMATSNWSPRLAGTPCGVMETCLQQVCSTAGECVDQMPANGTSCDDTPGDCIVERCIAGACVEEMAPNGSSCSEGCISGTCQGGGCMSAGAENGCSEGGDCYQVGADHPTDPCLDCSTTGWKATEGDGCGGNNVCNADGDCCAPNDPTNCST